MMNKIIKIIKKEEYYQMKVLQWGLKEDYLIVSCVHGITVYKINYPANKIISNKQLIITNSNFEKFYKTRKVMKHLINGFFKEKK